MAQIHINTIADLCAQQGVRHAIISPGSRNAPLTIAFNRHPKIECLSISDERSAAFIAMGIAQSSQNPVVIICTSGSAALNYAPAVAEAYFQQVPLIVLTADRPPEWIDQWDGQTIRQENIYGKHVRATFNLPLLGENGVECWQAYRMVNEALDKANGRIKGPVQINLPFREPFYPEANSAFELDKTATLIRKENGIIRLSEELIASLTHKFSECGRVGILLGQDNYSNEFLQLLDEATQKLNIPVYADVISNGHQLQNAVQLTDSCALNLTDNGLQPEMIISFGKSIISKNFKLFLRKASNSQWHITTGADYYSDPFQTLTSLIECSPTGFIHDFLSRQEPKNKSFLEEWKNLNTTKKEKTADYLNSLKDWSEFSALNELIKQLPENSHLHLANSLSVRYINFIGLQKSHTIWCNRGTSGIDGSTSTAMGHALAKTSEEHFLITGDVAFFYDRNAFWHKYPYPNLKIILLNNQGGSIFRMIKGPKEQQELEEFFETKQSLTAKHLCNEFGIGHYPVNAKTIFEASYKDFLHAKGPSLIEIQSDSKVNQKIFESFKSHITN